MSPEQVTALRNLLSSVTPKGRLTATDIDALVVYMAEVTKTEDEAIQRLSTILQNDLPGITAWRSALQLELLREKILDHQDRIRSLEAISRPTDPKWAGVQAIFTAISFIAATVALLKAFGLLNLPWL